MSSVSLLNLAPFSKLSATLSLPIVVLIVFATLVALDPWRVIEDISDVFFRDLESAKAPCPPMQTPSM
jgi:hypothetical protein